MHRRILRDPRRDGRARGSGFGQLMSDNHQSDMRYI